MHALWYYLMKLSSSIEAHILIDAGSVVSAVENATAPLVASIASNTAISPAPADKPASKAAVPPSAFALIGDGSLFGGDSSWAYGDSKYAIPATIVLVLVLFAGVGLFIVYWRRKRASNYYGLKEAELNSVQMHRS